jgi:oxalate decarboxylase/phosphoglucose isomerase-like protein (cupin superfamily)
MGKRRIPVVTSVSERPREGADITFNGDFTWFSLLDSKITPTHGLTVGIAELKPGDASRAHWHSHPELYYFLSGHGTMEIDHKPYAVGPGTTVYVPGDALHTVKNDTGETMKILYAFAANSLSEVEYRFPDGEIARY